jgi:hypothetical protein
MNNIRLLLVACAAWLYLCGCASNRTAQRTPESVTIKVTGHPGTTFTGTIVANGVSQRVSGTPSAVFQPQGHRLTCSFKQGAESGWLRFEIYAGSQFLGASGTVGPYSRCGFTFRNGKLTILDNWRFLGELND